MKKHPYRNRLLLALPFVLFACDGGGSRGAPMQDTTLPEVTITSPAAFAVLSGVVNIAVACTDNSGKIKQVEFFVDGVRSALKTAPPFTFSWDTSSNADGIHIVIARCTDAAGNWRETSICVTVRGVPPIPQGRPVYIVMMSHIEGDFGFPEAHPDCLQTFYQSLPLAPPGTPPPPGPTFAVDIAGTELLHEIAQNYRDAYGGKPKWFLEPTGEFWQTEADVTYGNKLFARYDYLAAGYEFGVQGHAIYYSGNSFCWYNSPHSEPGIQWKFRDMHNFAEQARHNAQKVNHGKTYTGGHKLERGAMGDLAAEQAIARSAFALGYRISYEDHDGHTVGEPPGINNSRASYYVYRADYGGGVQLVIIDMNGSVMGNCPGNTPRCETPAEAVARLDRTLAARQTDSDPDRVYYFAFTIHSDGVWSDFHATTLGQPMLGEGLGLTILLDAIRQRVNAGANIKFVTPMDLAAIFEQENPAAPALTNDFTPPTGRASGPGTGGPWINRLMLATSSDGLHFTRAHRVITDQGAVPDLAIDARGWIYLYYVGWTVGNDINKTVVAISPDNGATWYFKRVILSGFEGMPDAVDPDIQILSDGRFRLYLTTAEQSQPPRTYYAESADGIHFTRMGVAFNPPGDALDPSTALINGVWRIFAGGRTPTPGANWRGSSADGTSFSYDGEIVLTKDGHTQALANIIPVLGGFRLYTFPHHVLPYINSFFTTDGVNWTAELGVRLKMDASAGLESLGVADPAVVRLANGTYLMVYVTVIPEAPQPACEDVAPDSGVFSIEDYEGWVTDGNGNRLYTRIVQPVAAQNPGKCFAALVPIPGGTGDGAPLADSPLYRDLAARGFLVVAFNAPGRGNNLPRNLRSDGPQNYNGFADQDALKAIIDYTYALPNVTKNNIGVQTSSFGISTAAGALGRYTTLPVKYPLDVEGPSDCFNIAFETYALDADPSNDRHEQFRQMTGHYCTTRDPAPENQAWWAEREALRFIGRIRARCMRAQNQWDHAQPPNLQYSTWDYPPLWYQNKHAVDMVNTATNGASPWTRMNGSQVGPPPFEPGNLPNTTYTRESPPKYERAPQNGYPLPAITFLILELAQMPPL
jgi:hypothetical protein